MIMHDYLVVEIIDMLPFYPFRLVVILLRADGVVDEVPQETNAQSRKTHARTHRTDFYTTEGRKHVELGLVERKHKLCVQ